MKLEKVWLGKVCWLLRCLVCQYKHWQVTCRNFLIKRELVLNLTRLNGFWQFPLSGLINSFMTIVYFFLNFSNCSVQCYLDWLQLFEFYINFSWFCAMYSNLLFNWVVYILNILCMSDTGSDYKTLSNQSKYHCMEQFEKLRTNYTIVIKELMTFVFSWH
jgi:hypothetical protein